MPQMTKEVAALHRFRDELQTVIREALDECFTTVEGGGKVWITGLGIVTPDNPETAALGDLAYFATGAVAATVKRRVSEWLRGVKS